MSARTRTVSDPDGRTVAFDDGTRLHLALHHPALLDEEDLILSTIQHPDFRDNDLRPGRERFYRRHVLDPRRWLRVVVEFDETPAWVVTAFVQDVDPRRDIP